MATIRLLPSSYTRSNSNYVTVTDPSNMYNNTDNSSSYCSLRGRGGRSTNNTYYVFIHGFDFNLIPSNAIITGFKIKIKAYRNSYMSTGNVNYHICMASQPSNTYKISNSSLSTDITTSSDGEVYELPIPTSLYWSTLTGYGSDFSIEVPLRNNSSSSSNYPYVYVYGAEIEVTCNLPVTIPFRVKQNGSWVTPTKVLVKDSGTWKEASKILVKDNGTWK